MPVVILKLPFISFVALRIVEYSLPIFHVLSPLAVVPGAIMVLVHSMTLSHVVPEIALILCFEAPNQDSLSVLASIFYVTKIEPCFLVVGAQFHKLHAVILVEVEVFVHIAIVPILPYVISQLSHQLSMPCPPQILNHMPDFCRWDFCVLYQLLPGLFNQFVLYQRLDLTDGCSIPHFFYFSVTFKLARASRVCASGDFLFLLVSNPEFGNRFFFPEKAGCSILGTGAYVLDLVKHVVQVLVLGSHNVAELPETEINGACLFDSIGFDHIGDKLFILSGFRREPFDIILPVVLWSVLAQEVIFSKGKLAFPHH